MNHETSGQDFWQRVSDYDNGEVDIALKNITSLNEPLMITVMGFVVGGIAPGLLPVFSPGGGG